MGKQKATLGQTIAALSALAIFLGAMWWKSLGPGAEPPPKRLSAPLPGEVPPPGVKPYTPPQGMKPPDPSKPPEVKKQPEQREQGNSNKQESAPPPKSP